MAAEPFVFAAPSGLVFWVALYGWIASEWFVSGRRDRRNAASTRTGHEGDRGTLWTLMGGTWAGIGSAIAAAWALPGLVLPGSPEAWLLVGSGLWLGGIILRVWAIRVLGRYFRRVVTVAADHQLVTTGSYRVIRHPAYAGTLATCLGLGVMLDNGASVLLVLVLPLAGHVHRLLVEEAVLQDQLGDAYAAYRRRTWRLLPGVW